MTITLNGSDLTVTQVVAVARHGEAVVLSARRLAEEVQLCARVAAIELVVAAQAIDLRALCGVNGSGRSHGLGLGTGRADQMIRELVPFTQADGTLPADLEPLVELVTRGDLTPADPARLYSDDRPIPCPHAGAGPGPDR